MNKYGLRKRPTFDELIYYLRHQPKIKFPDRSATRIINSFEINNIDVETKPTTKVLQTIPENEIIKPIPKQPNHKSTQLDYVIQDWDINPENYNKVDTIAKSFKTPYETKRERMTRTIRYLLKDLPSPQPSLKSSDSSSSSSNAPSDKPSDGPSEPEPKPKPKKKPIPTQPNQIS